MDEKKKNLRKKLKENKEGKEKEEKQVKFVNPIIKAAKDDSKILENNKDAKIDPLKFFETKQNEVKNEDPLKFLSSKSGIEKKVDLSNFFTQPAPKKDFKIRNSICGVLPNFHQDMMLKINSEAKNENKDKDKLDSISEDEDDEEDKPKPAKPAKPAKIFGKKEVKPEDLKRFGKRLSIAQDFSKLLLAQQLQVKLDDGILEKSKNLKEKMDSTGNVRPVGFQFNK